MTVLPRDDGPFAGVIAALAKDSTPSRPQITRPPSTAPNVVVVMLDDVGFGAPSTFGGPVPTPTLDRVAAQGLRYNQFHTTALCSPTRAALLTGRNHHSAHMGAIGEIAYGYPGYDGVIPRSTATVAEILRMHGYSTSMFGKGHFTPLWETGPAGPYDRSPTGMGFDRFYGFLGAECSQWEPALYDQTTPIEPALGREDYHLTEDLADQAISWLRQQRAGAPDLPFFMYFSPGATHSPHHVWPQWIDRFTGQFDAGWDVLRQQTHARQLEQGVIPSGTALTPRPAQLPAWDDYDDRYKPVAARLMEVYAGFLAHTDAQVGRLVDELERLGVWEDTLFIYVSGDNGASAEGTLNGVWSAPSFQNGVPEDPEWLLEHVDDFGSKRCENHFNAAWAWALDAPFQWTKQVASHFGGTRNGIAISWPDGIAARGELRSQFHHVIDIVPTILAAAGIEEPAQVSGIEQKPVEGVSMNYSFDSEDHPSTHVTQYFEILGNRAIYHDGWVACCFHGRVPWVRSQALPFGEGSETWELYHVAEDFSQAVDLAAEHPERLAELQALFDVEAARYDVHPLSDETTARALPANRPSHLEGRTNFTFYPQNRRMPELASVNVKNTSFEITAHVAVPACGAQGVLICQGGSMAGWSFYLDTGGRPTYVYNWFGHELFVIAGTDPVAPGQHVVGVRFAYDGGGLGMGGVAGVHVDGLEVASGRVERTVPFIFSMSGETMDVGIDTCSPVGTYPEQFAFTGTIDRVDVQLDPAPDRKHREAFEDGQLRGALSQQ